jgi:NAD-dependent SIR2 family protein deacetylase
MEVASLAAFRHHPGKFYAWIRPLAKRLLEAQPNPAHRHLGSTRVPDTHGRRKGHHTPSRDPDTFD